MGKILCKNGQFDQNRIVPYSKEIGKIMSILCDFFQVNKKISDNNLKKNEYITSKDYNLYKYINDNIMNRTIFLINKLSTALGNLSIIWTSSINT